MNPNTTDITPNSNSEADGNRQAPPLPEERGPGGEVHYRMYTTDAARWKKTLKGYACTNRQQPTEAEDHLWQELRNHKLGARFRRQHAIQQFIVDFVCLEAWLIIEVDGSVHADASQAEYDGGRTHNLQEAGSPMKKCCTAHQRSCKQLPSI
jgi:very-short-patch-repair endonuclease